MKQKPWFAVLTLCLTMLFCAAAQAVKLPSAEELLIQYPDIGFALPNEPQTDPLLDLVNREHLLKASYKPTLAKPKVAKKRGAEIAMQPEAAEALEAMFLAAQENGLELVAISGYRSYGKQKTLYARSVERNGQAKADTMSARPGASEHQLGLAMDISCASLDHELTSKFTRKAEGKWVAAHCSEYGFIIRYQDDWESITGYQGEPWHIRYVGKQHAACIALMNVPFETYLDYVALIWQKQQDAGKLTHAP